MKRTLLSALAIGLLVLTPLRLAAQSVDPPPASGAQEDTGVESPDGPNEGVEAPEAPGDTGPDHDFEGEETGEN